MPCVLGLVLLIAAGTTSAAKGKMATCSFDNDATRASATSDDDVYGSVFLYQASPVDPLLIVGQLRGLKNGSHGFHIHTGQALVDGQTPSCAASATGGHYNPINFTHGGPGDATRHIGDLGNILASVDGIAPVTYTEDRVGPLAYGPSLYGSGDREYVLGRAMVVHAGQDSLQSGPGGDNDRTNYQYTGGAGGRVGCCIITEFFPRAVTDDSTPKMATCEFDNLATRNSTDDNNNVFGKVYLFQDSPNEPLSVVGKLAGLQGNQDHGFHIHSGTSLVAGGAYTCGSSATGGHYNPQHFNHAGPGNLSRHVGDLGNVAVDSSGLVTVLYVDDRNNTSGGPSLYDSAGDLNVLLRSMVTHSGTDNQLPGASISFTGAAGSRVGCCIINEVLNATSPTSSPISGTPSSAPTTVGQRCNQDNDDDDEGLTGGEIAGAVIGTLIGVTLVGAITSYAVFSMCFNKGGGEDSYNNAIL